MDALSCEPPSQITQVSLIRLEPRFPPLSSTCCDMATQPRMDYSVRYGKTARMLPW